DGASAVALGASRVLVAGGYPLGDDPMLAPPSSLIYDAQLDRWSAAGATGTNHRGAELVAIGNGRAILVGGHGPDQQPSPACLVFNGHRWQPTEPLPGPWSGYALVS